MEPAARLDEAGLAPLPQVWRLWAAGDIVHQTTFVPAAAAAAAAAGTLKACYCERGSPEASPGLHTRHYLPFQSYGVRSSSVAEPNA